MALILDGTTGASAVQDGSVTDTDLSLTANSAAIKVALNADNGAPIYACRAWVNFNGTGTVAIRASGNVSSITDNGTGDYTVNFTTAMSDANYCAVAGVHFFAPGSLAGNDIVNMSATAVGNARIVNFESGAKRDPAQVFAAIFR